MNFEKGTFCVVPVQMLKGLLPACQTVFMWICFHSNNDGVCWPSIDLLSEECGISRTPVIEAIKKLESLGYLIKKRRRNSSTIYKVIIKNVKQPKPKLGQEVLNQDFQNQEFQNQDPGSLDSRLPKVLNQDSNYTNELNPKNYTHKDIVPSDQKAVNALESGFDEFYNLYPRKKNRKGALKIWVKQKLWEKKAEIIDKLGKQVWEEWRGKDLQYIPLPTTYLNGERWLDEIENPSENKSARFNNETNLTHRTSIAGNRIRETEREIEALKRQGII